MARSEREQACATGCAQGSEEQLLAVVVLEMNGSSVGAEAGTGAPSSRLLIHAPALTTKRRSPAPAAQAPTVVARATCHTATEKRRKMACLVHYAAITSQMLPFLTEATASTQQVSFCPPDVRCVKACLRLEHIENPLVHSSLPTHPRTTPLC
jgi:hypothetical protein